MPDNRITVRLPDHLLEWIQLQTNGEKGKTSKLVIEALEIARLEMSDTCQTQVRQESDIGQTLADIVARIEALEALATSPPPPPADPKPRADVVNSPPRDNSAPKPRAEATSPPPPAPACPKCGSSDTKWKSFPQRKMQCKTCGKFTTLRGWQP